MGRATAHFFAPPLGPWGGYKWSNIIKLQLHSKFQRLLTKLCVFSHTKNIKPIRRDFIWPPGSCPRGGTWGYRGGWSWGHFFRNSTRLGVRVTYMNGTCTGAIFYDPPPPLVPWGGTKRSNIIKSELQSQFQRFLNQTHK